MAEPGEPVIDDDVGFDEDPDLEWRRHMEPDFLQPCYVARLSRIWEDR